MYEELKHIFEEEYQHQDSIRAKSVAFIRELADNLEQNEQAQNVDVIYDNTYDMTRLTVNKSYTVSWWESMGCEI